MASYKDILKLVREGKTPQEIRAAIPGPPSAVRRLLTSPRLVASLELDRNLSVRLARHRLSAAMHHLIERRLELVDDENLLVACKAAENLTEAYIGKPQSPKEALKEMQVQQKLEFLKELWTVGGVDSRLLTKNSGTGKYGFEDAIEAAQKAKQGPVK
jgi:hypothetical protein